MNFPHAPPAVAKVIRVVGALSHVEIREKYRLRNLWRKGTVQHTKRAAEQVRSRVKTENGMVALSWPVPGLVALDNSIGAIGGKDISLRG